MFHFLNIIIQKEKFYYFIYGEKIHNINGNNKTHAYFDKFKIFGDRPKSTTTFARRKSNESNERNEQKYISMEKITITNRYDMIYGTNQNLVYRVSRYSGFPIY